MLIGPDHDPFLSQTGANGIIENLSDNVAQMRMVEKCVLSELKQKFPTTWQSELCDIDTTLLAWLALYLDRDSLGDPKKFISSRILDAKFTLWDWRILIGCVRVACQNNRASNIYIEMVRSVPNIRSRVEENVDSRLIEDTDRLTRELILAEIETDNF